MVSASEIPDPNKALFAGGEALTFDDVLVVPGYSEVLPDHVDTTTQLGSIELRVPLLSAAMDTVTEAPLAVAMAREGGIGILHRNLSPEDQAAEVCLLYTSPSPRDRTRSRMPSSA